MKMLTRFLLMLVAAGFGLAAGFALRGKLARPTSETRAPQSDAPAQHLSFSKPRTGLRVSDISPLATELEHTLAMSSGVTRWLYWLEALEKAAPSDFPRLARLAQGDSATLRLVCARWADVAPRHYFDTLVAAGQGGLQIPIRERWDFYHALFDVWTRRDPDAVIAALNEPGDYGMRNAWRMEVATLVIRTDVERGLRLFADWHIESYDPGMGAVAKWATANPRHAAEFTRHNSVGYVAERAMETIGKEWGKTDPAGALAFAAAQPNNLGSLLGTAALKQWAQGAFAQAAQWLAATDGRVRNRFSPAFVEAWAQKDAGSALAWCGENLAGSSLVQAVGGVLRGAAAKDLAGAAALVASMEPSPARAEAAMAVAKKWFPELSSGKPVKPEALAWLADLDADSTKRVIQEVQWDWATSDPKSMATFVAAASSDAIPAQACSHLAEQLARQDPLEALAWASRLPAAHSLTAGAEAFTAWRNSQPEAAMEWFNALPSDDPRRKPFFQGAIRALAWHPQAAEQLAVMSPAERALARSVIETMSLPGDRKTSLLNALTPR